MTNTKISKQKNGIDLSKLETTVLYGICRGLSSKELAKIIHRSPRTIDDYRKGLCKKFEVQNKEQLIAKAVALEIVVYDNLT